jgi:hypothetical protein
MIRAGFLVFGLLQLNMVSATQQLPVSTYSMIQSLNQSQSPVPGYRRSNQSIQELFDSFVSKITNLFFQTKVLELHRTPQPEPTCTPPYTFAS